MWASGLSHLISGAVLRSPQCVSCDQLKKGVPVPKTEVITEANAWIEPNFSLIEHPMGVLDQRERKTQRHTIKMYKIQWSHHTEEEATWETENYLNTKYPGFLQSQNCKFLFLPCSFESNLGTRFLLRG
jgi:hypothetical protein